MRLQSSSGKSVSPPVYLWTALLLALLANGVSSTADLQPRLPWALPQPEFHPYDPSTLQETYNVINFLQEFVKTHQQQQNSNPHQFLQMYNNGEDLSESRFDWPRVPLPLLYQISDIINGGSKEETKRGGHMALCHFKICNLGRKKRSSKVSPSEGN